LKFGAKKKQREKSGKNDQKMRGLAWIWLFLVLKIEFSAKNWLCRVFVCAFLCFS